ncbi:PD40 domain-containing protein [Aquimarina sp. AU474]|uniref:PD40 domain-containing protein n=1 Tax=Aquimarina sp. AU474 TaxID=2108529 RepID=UPI00135C4733|nr:PD40 domain-containing protein [Aquimarina sp. AU474]
MKYLFKIILVLCITASCNQKHKKSNTLELFFKNSIPKDLPIPFMPELTAKNDLLIHRGVFSNDYTSYYYTVSDKSFKKFDVKVVTNSNGNWSQPKDAFFNSTFSDHGMSFSPDGNTLYFSSTRPLLTDTISNTWHIWKSKNVKGLWTNPEYVNIPNLSDKLISHPTIAKDGTLYFHSSNTDYSEMSIYYSEEKNGQFQNASKVPLTPKNTNGYCTPYISPDNDYLIYAAIGQPLELYISHKNATNQWSFAKKLPPSINQNGQGNPYITADGKFLFYARENDNKLKGWNIYCVSTEQFINKSTTP